MTVPERFLWYLLRDRRLARLKFRRQHPIGGYFVDFYCAAFQLVIEVDGQSHDDRGEYDARRQHDLERRGLKVLRVSNDDILDDPESIVLGILKVVGTDRGGPRIRPGTQSSKFS
jgi:very-short-patch-repair endonuclease